MILVGSNKVLSGVPNSMKGDGDVVGKEVRGDTKVDSSQGRRQRGQKKVILQVKGTLIFRDCQHSKSHPKL